MSDRDRTPVRLRWAERRLSIIGPLLADPPEHGELAARLTELAARSWRHPSTGEAVRFSISTLERWFYKAKSSDNVVEILARKVPKHAGTQPSLGGPLRRAIELMYREHPSWTVKLHYDNIRTLAAQDATLGSVPSYGTFLRFMRAQGLMRQKKKKRRAEDATSESLQAPRELRSFEVEHVHGLWHLDFHEGSRKVLLPSGDWKKPMLLGILDDRSRLCCHLQWYLEETAAALIHGVCQAIQKRGLPRSLLTDNGSAMLAAETVEGLGRHSIVHYKTLPYSPEQNGKQENFWCQIEGRLLPMLEGHSPLTLELLNSATQAWVELEYNRAFHSEIKQSPLERMLQGPEVSRKSPSSEELRRAFRTEQSRSQRRSDGTISIEGVRFELPSRYRALTRVSVRIARFDLSSADLVDGRTGQFLTTLLPIDKSKNADRKRRVIESESMPPPPTQSDIAPLLKKLMADYAATGLPPAYLPFTPSSEKP
jgi:transposase InsO family protein